VICCSRYAGRLLGLGTAHLCLASYRSIAEEELHPILCIVCNLMRYVITNWHGAGFSYHRKLFTHFQAGKEPSPYILCQLYIIPSALPTILGPSFKSLLPQTEIKGRRHGQENELQMTVPHGVAWFKTWQIAAYRSMRSNGNIFLKLTSRKAAACRDNPLFV
jgi:hypothetical protein